MIFERRRTRRDPAAPTAINGRRQGVFGCNEQHDGHGRLARLDELWREEPMLTDQQKTDIRRFCGYPAYGASPAGNIGWRFYVAYGLLEYRMNNLSPAEIAVVVNYLATLNQLEAAVPTASDNLDSDSAASWKHNRSEIADRLQLFDEWRRRLCSFFGVPPGEGLDVSGVRWVV